MEFLNPLNLSIITIIHIIGVIIGVGSVTITDYFHLIGLKSKKLEKKLLIIYPFLGKLIIWNLFVIIISGLILLFNHPELLQSSLFILKISLFLIVVINGIVLHKIVQPNVIKCVIKEKKYCSQKVLLISSISGAISFTTWYSILILALTKKFNYSVSSFISIYLIALIIIFLITFLIEKKSRVWRKD